MAKAKKLAEREYVRFKEIGDKIKGSYRGVEVIRNTMSNEDMNMYLLKRRNKTFCVFGKPGIDKQMTGVQAGQIIQFEYTQELPPKMPGHSSTRVIEVFGDVNEVDGPFLLAENRRLQEQLELVKSLVGVSKKKKRRLKITLEEYI